MVTLFKIFTNKISQSLHCTCGGQALSKTIMTLWNQVVHLQVLVELGLNNGLYNFTYNSHNGHRSAADKSLDTSPFLITRHSPDYILALWENSPLQTAADYSGQRLRYYIYHLFQPGCRHIEVLSIRSLKICHNMFNLPCWSGFPWHEGLSTVRPIPDLSLYSRRLLKMSLTDSMTKIIEVYGQNIWSLWTKYYVGVYGMQS